MVTSPLATAIHPSPITASSATLVAAATPRAVPVDLAALRTTATAAVDALGTGPLQPVGAVREAFAHGRLVGEPDPTALAQVEATLRTGTIDLASKHAIGSGMNGMHYRYDIVGDDGSRTATVLRTPDAQSAQETLGWLLGRDAGIGDILTPTAMRPNGESLSVFRTGVSPAPGSPTDARSLDIALAVHELARSNGTLAPIEAAQAARIKRQVLQALDYVTANPDRSRSNIKFDQAIDDPAARGGISAFDWGMLGRGAQAPGGSELRPALSLYQGNGHVDLDPVVVQLLATRLTPARIAELHASVFGGATSSGDRLSLQAADPSTVTGMQRRLDYLLTHGGYDHASYTGDTWPTAAPEVDARDGAHGLNDTRSSFNDPGSYT